ncbi:3,4-dihydroxy-2-butanone-4-phosphate synthase [Lutibaculum baratangense]|uniref:3,4-dihydroxy-2-butanone 4-phosphate synthase n=1 Tax=Lutibaculum baratangense AMV1 TaxID=631454 RepID=V4TEX1_9HYPH|nr:3,4-dihydroxy-2-butanone-4-phosphate synthase [Lutibaculum baratangense]ESR24743.1 3,4-dihydroxy-2-butanone 4-phosphate synthase [Lutibaculum baratangense AMV1]
MTEEMRRVAEVIRAFERGEMVIVTDDDDRENEGDLIVAASHATSEKMAFIIRHTSGIVCAPMTREEAKRLNLQPMVADNDAPHSTAFTVSVDYRHGTTTGISAEERVATVRALANPNSGAGDFVRPGHVFPLIAREGGVLMRSGHTEAAVDLCRLAGLPPVGVIGELVNDDGTVKRGAEVRAFGEAHGLQTVSVADLIAYRQRQERLVERVAEAQVETFAGAARAITYSTQWDPVQHLALVFGDIRDGESVPVRLHRETVLDDVFGRQRRIEAAAEWIAREGRGIIVYLREGAAGVAPENPGRPREGIVEEHGSAQARVGSWREIGVGAQILRDLGVSTIRLLTTQTRHYVGLAGFGIEIVSTELIDG